MQVVFLHGAWSSSKVFNYIIQSLGLSDNYIALEYNTKNSFQDNFDELYNSILEYPEVFFIAHSLGGIYALHLADAFDHRCVGGVTIATPYGGIDSPPIFQFLYPSEPVFKYMSPMSKIIWYNSFAKHPPNWTQIVCKSSGAPWIKGQNDGVVSVSSQQWISSINLEMINCGHHEVLQDPETVEIIKTKLNIGG